MKEIQKAHLKRFILNERKVYSMLANQSILKNFENRLQKYEDLISDLTESGKDLLSSQKSKDLSKFYKDAEKSYNKFKNATQEDYDDLKEAAEEAFDKLKNELEKNSKNLLDYGKQEFNTLRQYVEEKPIQSTLIAFSIGFIIAKFLKVSK